MKKGFTLIELLAVIAILAIIALITTPMVLQSVNESKESSAIRSAELYMDAVEQAIARQHLETDLDIKDGWYKINSEGNVILSNMILDVHSKNKPKGGEVYIEALDVVKVKLLNVNKRYVSSNDDGKLVVLNIKVYEPGEVVYFDVKNGISCTENDYKISKDNYAIFDVENETSKNINDYGNSISGYNGLNGSGNQNNCLMFYVLHDDGDNVTLILDHNVNNDTSWSENDISEGPVSALLTLKTMTSSWKGTLTPTSYTYHRDEDSCYYSEEECDENGCITNWESVECDEIDYTINYSEYKARLITAEEVLELVGVSNYNKYSSVYLGDGNMSTSEMRNNLGWLFDRLSPAYEDYIPNVTINDNLIDNPESGYWTATASSYYDDDSDNSVYAVNGYGSLEECGATFNNNSSIRPVIEVSKTNLK